MEINDTFAKSINEIKEISQESDKTPSELREEKLEELYEKLLEARSQYKNSPLTLQNAEKAYYTLKDGVAVYKNSKYKKYKEESNELKKKMVDSHNKNMNKAFESLAYYESQVIYKTNINFVKLSLLEKILGKIKEIQEGSANKDNNNRKTFYMAQEQEWLTMCIQLINYALMSFTIVFIIYSVREHNVNTFTYMLIIFLVFVTFYLETIVKWASTIPTSINVYTAWGEDSDQSTFVFWGIFMVILFVFAVLYTNNDKINNYFN